MVWKNNNNKTRGRRTEGQSRLSTIIRSRNAGHFYSLGNLSHSLGCEFKSWFAIHWNCARIHTYSCIFAVVPFITTLNRDNPFAPSLTPPINISLFRKKTLKVLKVLYLCQKFSKQVYISSRKWEEEKRRQLNGGVKSHFDFMRVDVRHEVHIK